MDRKILHVLDHSLPLHSGYSFRTHSIFKAQKKLGWEPIGLTSAKHSANAGAGGSEVEVFDAFRYYRIRDLQKNAGMSPYHIMFTLLRRMNEVVQKEDPDLIHAHSPVLNAIPAYLCSRRNSIPFVYEIRAFWEDAAVDHGTYAEQSWKYRLTRAVEAWACRRAAHVAVLCNGLKEDLIRRGICPEKLTIIGNGVEPWEFEPAQPDPEFRVQWGVEQGKTIGFIGSFYRYEGLDLLIRAFAELCSGRKDLKLLLVGGGEMETALRSQAEDLHLGDKVVFSGRIPQERISGVYALVDILVYPRNSMRLTELVTPLKPLEAMASKKAVVASDVGGHRELIQHGKTGILFPAGNVSALVSAVSELLQDQERRNAIAENGLVWVRRERTWDRTLAPYSEIYNNIIKESENRLPVNDGRRQVGS